MPRAQQLPVYQDASRTVEERVEDALSRMSVREKISMNGSPNQGKAVFELK